MNFFQKMALVNKITKAIKKSKKIIDVKKGAAEEIKKHIENIENEAQAIALHLPEFRNIIVEIKEAFSK